MSFMLEQALRLGKTEVKLLALGQTSKGIAEMRGLTIEHFLEGEVVSVARTNGSQTVAVIYKVCPEYISLALGGGLEKQITPSNVPLLIRKLIGPYHVGGSVRVVPKHRPISETPWLFGQTDAVALTLGQDCTCNSFRSYRGIGFQSFFVGELVSVKQHGRNKVGIVLGFSSDAVEVSLGDESNPIKYDHDTVVENVYKFVDLFFLEDMKPFPSVTIGRTKFNPLRFGQPCDDVHRTKQFKPADFAPGEPVAIKLNGTSRLCGEVALVEADAVHVLNADGSRHRFQGEDIPEICKPDGSFYIVDPSTPLVVAIHDREQVAQVGRTAIRPLQLGQAPRSSELAQTKLLRLLPRSIVSVTMLNGPGVGEVDSMSQDLQSVTVDVGDNRGPISVAVGFVTMLKGMHFLTRTASSTTQGPVTLCRPSAAEEPPRPVACADVRSSLTHRCMAGFPFECRQRAADGSRYYFLVVSRTSSLGVVARACSISRLCRTPRLRFTHTACSGAGIGGTILIPGISAIMREVHTADKVREQIKTGRALRAQRTDEEVDRVFLAHAATDGGPRIPRGQLLAALRDLHAVVSETEVDQFLLMRSGAADGSVDLEDFREAARTAWAVETWAQSLPLAQLLADALPESPGCHRLRAASSLTVGEIADIAAGVGEALRELLTEHVRSLRRSFRVMDKEAGQAEDRRQGGGAKKAAEPGVKFSADISKMDCGDVGGFHRGLQKRVGSCCLNFLLGMQREHCSRAGSDSPITTTNYGLKTTPRREWELVMRLGDKPATEEELLFGRRIPCCKQLGDLEVAKAARLTHEEIVAVVLYTGPMFQVYNTVLRQSPKALFDSYKDNLFPTTIHVLVSAVQKLSRASRLEEGLILYRGMGGTVSLPQSFFRSDANGCKGFTEWGFMSTTSERKVAIIYSGVNDNKPLPMVLQIRVRSVDRGACIRDFSQYQSENEYLFVPCSFLEQEGSQYLEVAETGVVTIIPVRVNANLKTMTVEELLGQKKALHEASFRYLLDELQLKLREVAEERRAEDRLEKDNAKSLKGPHTVDTFLAKILSQCQEVYSRQEATKPSEYVKDEIFRRLVLDMVEVRAMAMSKLEEWLENESGSFMLYRFNASLKTVHRRRILFLEHSAMELTGENKRNASIALCKVKNLFINAVDERNDQDETPLMAAAAEGRSSDDLKLLVAAGADVNACRSADGVCAVWLAAQFGHVHCIKILVQLNADPNQAATNGATPAYTAAQVGNVACVEELANLRADLCLTDKDGLGVSHQAAMNGHCNVISLLKKLDIPLHKCSKKGSSPLKLAQDCKQEKCAKLLESIAVHDEFKRSSVHLDTVPVKGNLIISSGDLADVDRFLALAEYAKTGADVLFVMNYPAYLGVKASETDADFPATNYGLGYRYSAEHVLQHVPDPAPSEYSNFLAAYGDRAADGELIRQALTDMAFEIVRRVWGECCSEGSGSLLFCIGGINSINPLSPSAIQNEILLFSKLVSPPSARLPTEEGGIYNDAGKVHTLDLSKYSGVFLDCNGSMAFFNDQWSNLLCDPYKPVKVLAAFITGGVRAQLPLATDAEQNRFGSATANQLYHPQHTGKFLEFLSSYQVPTYVVTNNAVGNFMKKGLDQFLSSNKIDSTFLRSLAEAYYDGSRQALLRAPAYHTAVALRAFLDPKSAALLDGSAVRRTLFYNRVYGMTLVSECTEWEGARSSYITCTDTRNLEEDSPEARAAKEYFRLEHGIMADMNVVLSVPVRDVHFRRYDPEETKQYLVELGSP